MTPWSVAKKAFEVDGSLTDVYCLETNEKDWNRFLAWVAHGQIPHRFQVDGQQAELPQSIAQIHQLSSISALTLALKTAFGDLNCHFFSADELELHLDPRDIASERNYLQLVEVLQEIADTLGKPLVVAPESMPERAVFAIEPQARDDGPFHS